MDIDTKKELYEDIIDVKGLHEVNRKFVEEQLELSNELINILNVANSNMPIQGVQIEKYIDEMSDSIITMEQKTNNLNLIYLITERVNYKLRRTRIRLEKGVL